MRLETPLILDLLGTLIEDQQLNEFQIFDNYELEPTNNVIDIANYNYRLGNLRVNTINANSVLVLGNAAATQANLTLSHDQANAARSQANTARDTANDAYGQANTARTTANDAYGQANTARTTANDAYGQANTARTTANDSYSQANTARDTANGAYSQANGAYAQANSAYAHANIVYAQANAAYGQANAAYADSNTRVLKSGDTMTGNLIVSGATINTSIANISTIITGNTLTLSTGTGSNANIILSANGTEVIRVTNTGYIGINQTSLSAPLVVRHPDSVYGAVTKLRAGADEIDFITGLGYATVQNYYNSQGVLRDFGFTPINDAGGGERFKVLIGGEERLKLSNNGMLAVSSNTNTLTNATSNLHVFGNANITLGIVTGAGVNAATVNATTINASTVLTNSGINVSAQAADAYAQANTARDQANTAYGQANTARDQANTAYGQANSAYTQANNAYTAANNIASGATAITLKAYKDFLQANTNVNAANTCDLSVSNFFRLVMTASAQFTFINAPSSGTAQQFSLLIMQDATGGRSPTFANTVYWAGGSIPPATTAANSRDLWTFITYDGGSTYWGTLTMKDVR
jgi:hypothetical protein